MSCCAVYQRGAVFGYSLNASAYSLTVVCKSTGTSEEFRGKIREMRGIMNQVRDDDTVHEIVDQGRVSTDARDGVSFDAK